MHKIDIPASVTDRIMMWRGHLHFENLIGPKTALIVVDMQNAFVKPDAGHALIDEAASIVPNINRLATALRGADGTVVWIKNTFTEESLQSWSHFHEELWTPERTARRSETMARGTYGYALYDELDVQSGDLQIEKFRYSAFIQGSSTLETEMRSRGIDTLIITGTATNVCCESTARDAMMLNFRTIMVSDGNAAGSDEAHNASLASFWGTFGDVQSTDELIAQFGSAEVSSSRAADAAE